MLFRGVSSLNCPKFTKICHFLFILHVCPGPLKYALSTATAKNITLQKWFIIDFALQQSNFLKVFNFFSWMIENLIALCFSTYIFTEIQFSMPLLIFYLIFFFWRGGELMETKVQNLYRDYLGKYLICRQRR